MSYLPAVFIFRKSCGNARNAQIKVLRRQIRRVKKLSTLRSCGSAEELLAKFAELPLTEYEDYSEDVEAISNGDRCRMSGDPVSLLMPTSGTSGGTKLIPYNSSLLEEYRKGTAVWIGEMFRNNPALLAGRHYWSITPNTRSGATRGEGEVPVGFDSDTEYLGMVQRFFSSRIMAVPDEVAEIADMEAFEYVTLLFLVKAPDLRFISVWHPSFLVLLLRKLPKYFEDIVADINAGTIRDGLGIEEKTIRALKKKIRPDAKRAENLRAINRQTGRDRGVDSGERCSDQGAQRKTERVARKLNSDRAGFAEHIWPELKLISCWRGNESEPYAREIQKFFPKAKIEGKGIVATEGIVSFPLGEDAGKVLSINSHFFEFIDEETGENKFAWELEVDGIYSVVITTGNGLCRYKLHDRVRVTGFFREAPFVEFLGRDNVVSDMAGEKLHISHVENMISQISGRFNFSAYFAAVAPFPESDDDASGPVGHYKLYLYTKRRGIRENRREIEVCAEQILFDNFHYRHARNLGQLNPLETVFLSCDPTEAIRKWFVESGRRAGDIKIPRLLPRRILEIIERNESAVEAA